MAKISKTVEGKPAEAVGYVTVLWHTLVASIGSGVIQVATFGIDELISAILGLITYFGILYLLLKSYNLTGNKFGSL